MVPLIIAAVLVVGLEARADAFAACVSTYEVGPPPGSEVPPHARIVARISDPDPTDDASVDITATIAGQPVGVTVERIDRFLVLIEIDSDATGPLELDAPGERTLSYTVAASTATSPHRVTATIGSYDFDFAHTTVEEVWKGVAIAVRAPAVAFWARWRRDEAATWQTILVAARHAEATDLPAAWLGRLGCGGDANIPVALIEAGIELELIAILRDGTELAVLGLPRRVKPPPPPKHEDAAHHHSARTRGCASCTTGSPTELVVALVVLAVAGARRRSRRRGYGAA